MKITLKLFSARMGMKASGVCYCKVTSSSSFHIIKFFTPVLTRPSYGIPGNRRERERDVLS